MRLPAKGAFDLTFVNRRFPPPKPANALWSPDIRNKAKLSAAFGRKVRSECPRIHQACPHSKTKEIFKRWIASGAEYRPHWAFVAPKTIKPPVIKDGSWVKTPIDQFILAKLEAKAIAPAKPADPRTLIRRVSYDLLGLPPDPAWVEEFAKNPTDLAYEKFVDKLLADPRYGERWARPWLDLARYADTNGYEKDRTRTIWPWRDWVVRSLNADMPFDQFTIMQLAGDLLPGAGRRGWLPPAFTETP